MLTSLFCSLKLLGNHGCFQPGGFFFLCLLLSWCETCNVCEYSTLPAIADASFNFSRPTRRLCLCKRSSKYEIKAYDKLNPIGVNSLKQLSLTRELYYDTNNFTRRVIILYLWTRQHLLVWQHLYFTGLGHLGIY